MKNIVKLMGLFVLIGFSFFYTDKILEVIREEDEIMIKLTSVEDEYKVLPVDAEILGNTIIPGINGRSLNVTSSYNKMKSSGIFNESLLVLDYVSPSISVNDNKDKFIVRGNGSKNMVSIILVLDSDLYFSVVNDIFSAKEVEANYFVDYSYLINNSPKIKEASSGEFYSYGNRGEYNPDNLLFSNNLLTRIRGLEAKYCLSSDMNNGVLELCSENDLYTIVPTILGGSNPYANVKSNLGSGSIIMLDMNSETVSNLSVIIDYIKGKGYKIVGLSKLLSEELT